MGAMTPPSRKSCYNFRVVEINRVVDGDTIDVTIDPVSYTHLTLPTICSV